MSAPGSGVDPIPTRAVTSAAEWRAVMQDLGGRVPPPAQATGGIRRVVAPMLVGASNLFAVREGLLGHALRLRGAEVVFVLCDGLPACDARTYDNDPEGMCARCLANGEANLRAFGHTVLRASGVASRERIDRVVERARACPDDRLLSGDADYPTLGDEVFASTIRYLRCGRWIPDDPDVTRTGRRYLETALVMHEHARAMIERLRPDKVLVSHGFYATWGSWAAAAASARVAYDTCCGGWRRDTLLLHHDQRRQAHCDDLWPDVADLPLTAAEESALDAYLATREDNSGDYFQFISAMERDHQRFIERHGIVRERYRRAVGVFTNIAFDSATFRNDGPFPDMFTWVGEVVRRAAGHPDTLFLVKAHPAEVNYHEQTPERWRVVDAIRARFVEIPPNVRLVPPDDRVSPYTVYGLIDAGLVNTSSVGLEMALRGLPVLTTGNGVHYEKPGLVLAPRDRAHYFDLLDALASGTEAFRPDRERARRYAFALYFRQSIPFEPLALEGWKPVGLRIGDLNDLAPGRFPGLDVICRGILEGAPFALA